jgi:hypothetical protein
MPVGPLIVGTGGKGWIVIVYRAVAAPQPLVTVYFTVSVPALTPVTDPEADMFAFTLLTLHTPVVIMSDSVTLPPVQTFVGPVTMPELGIGLTETYADTLHPVAG